MSQEFYNLSSYIVGWTSLIIGIWSLIISYKGYFKAKKASIEAEDANRRIAEINNQKELAVEWKEELSRLNPSGQERINGLIALLSRMTNSPLIKDVQRSDLKTLMNAISHNMDSVDREGLSHTQLMSDMNKAEGMIKSVIDTLLFSA